MISSGQVSVADVLTHIDRALRGMCRTLTDLGDELANRRPNLTASNSPVAIVTHCCGVMEFWGGQVLADRSVIRDRAAEFTTTASVAETLALVAAQRARLAADLETFDGGAPIPGPLDDRQRADMGEFTGSQGGVLLHVYEELAQHRGQLDVTAHLLRHTP